MNISTIQIKLFYPIFQEPNYGMQQKKGREKTGNTGSEQIILRSSQEGLLFSKTF